MAKRFVDTAMGRKAWFRKLSPRLKCAWRFLTEECDQAGAWSIDLDSMEFHIGERVEIDEMLEAFNEDGDDRITLLAPDKLFLTGFVEFQYGELSEGCKPHARVIHRLKELNLYKGYSKGIQTLEEEEEDKEEDKKRKKSKSAFDFDALYRKYPRKLKPTDAKHRMERLIKTQEDYDSLSLAIDRFVEYHRKAKTEANYIPHMTSFLGVEDRPCWRDWLDPDTGSVVSRAPAKALKTLEDIGRELETF